MMPYQWILFDADETLFNFDAFLGLKKMFAQHDIDFDQHYLDEYEAVNQQLWIDYQNGDIDVQQLKTRRFERWAERLDVKAEQLNNDFVTAMATVCTPLEGALSLLNILKNKGVKLGIITNGFTDLQQPRLDNNGLNNMFDLVVVSEEVGFAKPHPAIFEAAYQHIGDIDKSQVLMVGDNPASDVLGAINFGFDSCWLNRANKTLPDDIKPTYHVDSLMQLQGILTA